jgi:hypothetical protein
MSATHCQELFLKILKPLVSAVFPAVSSGQMLL